MLDLSAVESLLITGTNGFVGRSVVNQISKLDKIYLPKRIALVTRSGINFVLPENLLPIITLIEQDLSAEWEFRYDVSHVINLAADGSNSPYSEEANQTFTKITQNLVSWVSLTDMPPMVFHASSGACYGRVPLEGRNSELHVKSSFAKNRIQAEDLLKSSSDKHNFSLTIGRLFTFSGSFLLEKGQYAITDFIRAATQGRDLQVQGDPRTVRSYLHQDAMAEWILASLIKDTSGSTLQIGSNHGVSIKELAECIARKMSVEVTFQEDREPGDIYLPDNQETRTKLGLDEGINWQEAIDGMITALRMESHD